MIFRLLVLLLCMASFAPLSSLAEDKSDDTPIEEILPVAPQAEDGFEGIEQNSFGAPTEKSFSSELLSKTRKKGTDKKARANTKGTDLKKATSKKKVVKGKAKTTKKISSKVRKKRSVKKKAPARSKAKKSGKTRSKVTKQKKATKKPVKKATKKESGKK